MEPSQIQAANLKFFEEQLLPKCIRTQIFELTRSTAARLARQRQERIARLDAEAARETQIAAMDKLIATFECTKRTYGTLRIDPATALELETRRVKWYDVAKATERISGELNQICTIPLCKDFVLRFEIVAYEKYRNKRVTRITDPITQYNAKEIRPLGRIVDFTSFNPSLP